MTFSFTKSRETVSLSSMWSNSEIHPHFLLPTLFNPLPPFPVLQKAAFRVQWNKISSPWPEAVVEASLVPNTMVSQVGLVHKQKQSPSLPTLPWGPGKLGSHTCNTSLLPQQQAGCQSLRHLGFGHMCLTTTGHWSSISLSASCRSAERSYKCICTHVKFSLTFVSLALCCARKIYLFYSGILMEVRKSFLKKHTYSFILKIWTNTKLLLNSKLKQVLFLDQSAVYL